MNSIDKRERREIFWIYVFVIVFFILIGLALYGYLSGAWEASAQQPRSDQIYQGVPIDAHLLEIDKRALQEAYHAHLIKLWAVWLSDGAADATRISKGLQIARRAYGQAAAQIAKREQELERR